MADDESHVVVEVVEAQDGVYKGIAKFVGVESDPVGVIAVQFALEVDPGPGRLETLVGVRGARTVISPSIDLVAANEGAVDSETEFPV